MKSKLNLLLFLIVLLVSCQQDNPYILDLKDTSVKDVKIHRYEVAMFEIPRDEFLTKVGNYKDEFDIFLEGDISDSSALIGLRNFFNDPYMIELWDTTKIIYPDLKMEEENLTSCFKYLKHYYPEIPQPRVFSYISGLDMKAPVKYVDNNILIGIDMYLGEGLMAYKTSGFPSYKCKWFSRHQIIPDVLAEISTTLIPGISNNANLLENMIYEGKKLYFIKSIYPEISDTILFKFTKSQLDWVNEYEKNIWGLIIENEYLYQNTKKIIGNFIDDGPFTPVMAKDSPARIGRYIGFKMVEKYCKKTNIPLPDLMMEADAVKILKMSKYKPG